MGGNRKGRSCDLENGTSKNTAGILILGASKQNQIPTMDLIYNRIYMSMNTILILNQFF